MGLDEPKTHLSELKQTFGATLRRRRIKCGLSQREMAIRHGFSQNGLSAVENGKSNISLSMMVRLAAAVDCEVPELLTKEDAT
jgi:transcriptional regulator with XRE-family HTH domain